MNKLLIGNVIALIASFLMVYTGSLMKKKKILYFQSIQISLLIISNIVLGGITGAIINTLSLIRNIICYKDKLGKTAKIILTILAVVLSLFFNNLNFIGLFPLVSTVTYIWLMNIKDIKKFKLLLAFTVFLWFIYDITIKSYTSAIFDLMTVIVSLVTYFILIKENNKK